MMKRWMVLCLVGVALCVGVAQALVEITNTADALYTLDDGSTVTLSSNEATTTVLDPPVLAAPGSVVRGSSAVLTATFDVGSRPVVARLPMQGGAYVDGSLQVAGTTATINGMVDGKLEIVLAGIDPAGPVTVEWRVQW